MSLLGSIRRQAVPIHPEGRFFIAGFALAAVIFGLIWSPLGWICLILTGWCAYFFRDPPRVTPQDDCLVISPADGVISSIGPHAPPPELGLGPQPRQRISVFMSVFDCHVNRAPVSGKIVKIAYRPGLFINADLDKASEDNERNGMVIETPDGTQFGIVQIAGLVARRIVCFVHRGDNLAAGTRLGLIRFGSRVDVYLPDGARALVALGSKAVAGETVLADLKSETAPRHFKRG